METCANRILTHSTQEYFENLAFKNSKKGSLNDFISEARTNLESKLTFWESSFNYLQNKVLFCTLYPRGYTAGGFASYNSRWRCQWLAGLKELRLYDLVFSKVIFSFYLGWITRNFAARSRIIWILMSERMKPLPFVVYELFKKNCKWYSIETLSISVPSFQFLVQGEGKPRSKRWWPISKKATAFCKSN